MSTNQNTVAAPVLDREPDDQSPSRIKASAANPAEHTSMLSPVDQFVHRHIGPDSADVDAMLKTIGYDSLEALIDAAVPANIRAKGELKLPGLPNALTERRAIETLRALAKQNTVNRSFIGMGYYGTVTPTVILRNVLENPLWYTQYTPYQAEIAQGRLEALLNFQTMVADLTALPLANASLLDEATAAAEAMAMAVNITGRHTFYVSDACHPQTIGVIETRAQSLGVTLHVGDADGFEPDDLAGVLVQYPTTDGRIEDYSELATKVHDAGGLLVCATDLLALTLIKPPGEFSGGGADIAVGSTQRFGMPMGGGGPHAAFIATHQQHARKLPGRLVGVSKDAQGNHALRLAVQTREQHIKRERATSNICTAQVLPAIVASMYAVYYGPNGLRRVAERVHTMTALLRDALTQLGHQVVNDTTVFDTIRVSPMASHASANDLVDKLRVAGINARDFGDGTLGFSCDETTTIDDLNAIANVFSADANSNVDWQALLDNVNVDIDAAFERRSGYLTHPVFNTHHSETEMLRYITKLQSRDLSLAHSMIPLGSCTMKLNATTEMIPITWTEFADIHPFAPLDQQAGYLELCRQLRDWLGAITGLPAVSLQPNAGSQGEYAGLMVIRAYHRRNGDEHRDVCLIPTSAHGTNPASAVIAGYRVVPVKCDDKGNIDLDDLRSKAADNADNLGALMITYPSTHGVFETTIKDVCKAVHDHGGQVYLDGANMNAMVGLATLGDLGADVCHLNLHKTFCIPHGGGGPGMGPICAAEHLRPFLPGHSVLRPDSAGEHAIGEISAAPYGSPAILPISWAYIAMMGSDGLTRATQVAILSANYMAARLRDSYDVLFTGPNGCSAHEFIIDCRDFQKTADIRIDDIAKRLMDYGFHAPTMAWPVPGTLMIEPTESEAKEELDRFCDALIAIRKEIADIENGSADRNDNVLIGAPHTIAAIASDNWPHPYSREQAVYPARWLRDAKFWPPVARIDNPYGDRNLVCTCPPMDAAE